MEAGRTVCIGRTYRGDGGVGKLGVSEPRWEKGTRWGDWVVKGVGGRI